MVTESVNDRKRSAKAEYCDLPGHEMEPPLDLDEDSSSEGQNDMRNHIHIEDYFNSLRDIKNESMLREMEAERRMQEISENNKTMFKEELHRIRGESGRQNMQQQNVINELLTQLQTPCSIFSGKKPKPLFFQILYWNNTCDQLRCPNNQDKHLPIHLQAMIQNHHMNQKDMLEDLVTNMEFQQNQEQILYGGNLDHPNSFE